MISKSIRFWSSTLNEKSGVFKQNIALESKSDLKLKYINVDGATDIYLYKVNQSQRYKLQAILSLASHK